MHDGLGISVREVATELGLPEGTVKSWVSHGPLLAAVAHRRVTTVVGLAVVVSIVAVLVVAGVFSAGPTISPARAPRDGAVEGFFRAVGGPPPSCRPGHETDCYPGYEELSGTVRLVPASGHGATYSTTAVDGPWKIEVPAGTYVASGPS